MKKQYRVTLLEIHAVPLLVEADDAADAIQRAFAGDCVELPLGKEDGYVDPAEENGTSFQLLSEELSEDDARKVAEEYHASINEHGFIGSVYGVKEIKQEEKSE